MDRLCGCLRGLLPDPLDSCAPCDQGSVGGEDRPARLRANVFGPFGRDARASDLVGGRGALCSPLATDGMASPCGPCGYAGGVPDPCAWHRATEPVFLWRRV